MKVVARIGTKVISLATAIIALILITYSGYVLYDTFYISKTAFSSTDLSQYRPQMNEDGFLTFEELEKINPDTIAWLKLFDTNIDYPVVQGKDDLEYASKDIFGHNSLTGAIYLTTANTKDFTNSFNLIYGHHMDNGAMFGDIDKYKDYDYFHAHRDGILVTTQGAYDLKIFARIGTDAYDAKIYSAGDRKSNDFPDFLEYVQSLSIQWQDGTDVYDMTDRVRTYLLAREENISKYGHFVYEEMPEHAIKEGLQLLALSTCSDVTTNGRQLLFASMKFRTEPLPEDMYRDVDEVAQRTPFGHGKSEYLALINILCAFACLMVFMPGLTIPAKFRRLSLMQKVNKEESNVRYNVKKFRIKLLIGILLEAALTTTGIILLLLTEDFSKRLAAVDEWTPIMLLILAVEIAVDILFISYRNKKQKELVT